MSLRIVAGRFGGRRIAVPAGRGTRPTREAVREAWFNALGARVGGAEVIDLYAGSGALGLEALSRGAARVHFVEADRGVLRTLRANLAALRVTESAVVVAEDAFRFLARVEERRWELALADPPYASSAGVELVRRFVRAPFAALLCIEHRPEALSGERAPLWRRRYGDTELSFFDAADRGVEREP